MRLTSFLYFFFGLKSHIYCSKCHECIQRGSSPEMLHCLKALGCCIWPFYRKLALPTPSLKF